MPFSRVVSSKFYSKKWQLELLKQMLKTPSKGWKPIMQGSLEWEKFVKDTRMNSLLLWDEISIFNGVNEVFFPLTDEEKF